MAAPYSMDLRERVLKAWEKSGDADAPSPRPNIEDDAGDEVADAGCGERRNGLDRDLDGEIRRAPDDVDGEEREQQPEIDGRHRLPHQTHLANFSAPLCATWPEANRWRA